MPDKPWIQGALTGLEIAGLLAAAMWRLARGESKNPILIVILLAGAALGFFVHIAGAVAGTLGVFAIPILLAAGAAAVGLLAVTTVAVARPVFDLNPLLLAGAVVVFIAERLGVSPVLLLVIAIVLGGAAGAFSG